MDADALVQQALIYMERGDYASARAALKQAASLAPLRADIRGLLIEAIEHSPQDAPPAESPSHDKPSKHPAPQGSASPPSPTGAASANGAAARAVASAASRTSLPGSSFGASRRRSPWLMARTVLALILFTALIALSAYIWRFSSSSSRSGLPSLSKPRATPTPDPLADKRREMAQEARRLADARNYEKAIEKIEELLDTNPPEATKHSEELAHYHFQIGRRDYKDGQIDRAIDHFESAVEHHPTQADYFLWLGRARYRRGRLQKGGLKIKDLSAAEQMFQRVIQLDPDRLEAYRDLAQAYIAQGKTLEGARYYRQIVARAPDSPEAINAKKQLRSMGMR